MLRPLADDENATFGLKRHYKFYNSTSASAELREAGRISASLVQEFETASVTRQDLRALVGAVIQRKENLDPEDQFYLEKKHAEFQRNRLGTSKRFTEIKKREQELLLAHRKSLNAPAAISLTASELDGLPEDTLAELEIQNGKLMLPLKKPHFETAMQWVKDGEVRKRIFIANDNRCPENLPRLKELILLRDESANLLGYENHVQFKMEEKMFKSHASVEEFMSDFQNRIQPIAKIEIDKLFALKKLALGDQITENENHLFTWDYAYYRNVLRQTESSFDEKAFSEYFELDKSLEGMMALFSQVFGMQFFKLSTDQYFKLGANIQVVWHDSVAVFTVWNDDQLGGGFLGYLYLDLFPRPNKYNHAGHYGLGQGFLKPDGTRHYPSAVLVMNLHTPSPTKPCLLKAEEARSLFHELGHAIHNLVTNTRYALMHATIARDFVEIPSIFLENFLWSHSVLKTIGSHYSYTSEAFLSLWEAQGVLERPPKELGDEQINRLIAAQNTTPGISALQISSSSAFDMKIHSSSRAELEALNLSETWNRMKAEITGLVGAEVLGEGWEWGHGCSRFGMFVRGYDAGSYSYVTLVLTVTVSNSDG